MTERPTLIELITHTLKGFGITYKREHKKFSNPTNETATPQPSDRPDLVSDNNQQQLD